MNKTLGLKQCLPSGRHCLLLSLDLIHRILLQYTYLRGREMKWYAIMMSILFLAMFGSMSAAEYFKTQKNVALLECHTAGMKSGIDAAQIKEICKE